MRKVIVCAQMITLCLLLVACGGKTDADADQLALDIRAEYIAMTACAGQMELTADYGERVYVYLIDFDYEKEGQLVLTVLEPDNIAGITARVDSEGTRLEFDGVTLETGSLSPDGLSPIDGLPALLTQAREGCIVECGFEQIGETETLRICCRDPEAASGENTEAAIWFDKSNHEMVKGEISVEGYTVIRCDFITFTFE